MAMKRIDAFFLLLFVVRGIALGDREGVKRPFTDGDVWSPSLKKTKCSTKPLEVTFDQPAKHWTDAIPIGNGRLGAMVWGGVANETINLNEDTLWTGNPGDYGDPGVPPILSEVRKLVDDGQYAAATTAALNMSGGSSAVYQLLGDIRLEFDDSHATYDKGTYKKVLDLDTATVKVEYSANGVGYVRKYFASNPDQVIAIKISGDKPAHVNFTAYLDSKMQHNSFVNDKNQIIMDGSCPGNPRGIQYSAVLDLQSNDGAGVVRVLDGQKLRAEGCNSAVILFVASSSFDGPFTNPANSKRDPKSSSLIAMDSVKRFSYADLYARHVDDYHELFHRVKLGLWKSSENVHANHSSSGEDTDKAISTAERVRNFKTDEDPSLVEILFQYGRYLLIACSRPGTQVANLQGIWNKDITPPWNGAQHLNINLQMNYWPSLPCNLHECQEPLFDFISSLSINGKKTAAVNYNASGWVAHQVSDIWAKTSPDSGQAVWALWQMGGAWLSTHLWEHYTYTLDKDFLRNKAYPLLESCASFLLDWLIEVVEDFLKQIRQLPQSILLLLPMVSLRL